MMSNLLTLTTALAAIALYLGASGYLFQMVRRQTAGNPQWLLALALCAMASHAVTLQQTLFTSNGIQLGLTTAISLIALIVNLLVLISGLKKPLHNLFIFTFPFTATVLLLSMISDPADVTYSNLNQGTVLHILLSILAYSLLIIATLQSLLLAYQNHQLRNHHLTGAVRLLPPLQTMESLQFELLWVGEVLLTLAIATGFIFLEDLFAQHLVHKTVFTLIAWCIYATLLWGRHSQGWRGTTALKWTLGGFCALMLAYFGSKFVLEMLL